MVGEGEVLNDLEEVFGILKMRWLALGYGIEDVGKEFGYPISGGITTTNDGSGGVSWFVDFR